MRGLVLAPPRPGRKSKRSQDRQGVHCRRPTARTRALSLRPHPVTQLRRAPASNNPHSAAKTNRSAPSFNPASMRSASARAAKPATRTSQKPLDSQSGRAGFKTAWRIAPLLSAVRLREDDSAKELRALARRSKDVNQSRRLLSLAAVKGTNGSGIGGEYRWHGSADFARLGPSLQRLGSAGPDRQLDGGSQASPVGGATGSVRADRRGWSGS